jgi:hypothetical protein
MKLTAIQLSSLKLLLQHRSKPLTSMDIMKASWRKYMLSLAVFIVAISACVLSGSMVFGVLLGGYLVGMVTRDFQWIRNQIEVLPLTSEITNWERVEQLIQEHEPPKA